MKIGWLAFTFVFLFLIACTPTTEEVFVAQEKHETSVEKNADRYLDEEELGFDWKENLTPEEYHILVEEGTERPFTGDLLEVKEEGVYVTAGCGLPVFKSEHKFDSKTGWPSFYDVIEENIVLKTDYKLIYPRTEILSKCGEHLGHVFNDGPEPTGKRYCINSLALDFVPTEELE